MKPLTIPREEALTEAELDTLITLANDLLEHVTYTNLEEWTKQAFIRSPMLNLVQHVVAQDPEGEKQFKDRVAKITSEHLTLEIAKLQTVISKLHLYKNHLIQ